MSVGQVVSLLEELTAKIDEHTLAAEDLEDDHLSHARVNGDPMWKIIGNWCRNAMDKDHPESFDMRNYIGQPKRSKYPGHTLPSMTWSAPGKA
jgi:hypothetical protein